MSMTRQSLIVCAFLLLAVNRAGAVERGVRDVVVDKRMKIVELPIQAGGLTTFTFDTEVKHVFSPDKDLFYVEILEDLGVEQVKHPPMILKIDDSVPAGTRKNIIVITEPYILSLRVRVTGVRQPGVELVRITTDHNSPELARSTERTVERRGGAHCAATARTKQSERDAGVRIRVTDVQRHAKGDAYIAFELSHLKDALTAVKVQLADVRGRRVADQVFWEASRSRTRSTPTDGNIQGLLRVANADALSGQPLTLIVSGPSGNWRVSAKGIQW